MTQEDKGREITQEEWVDRFVAVLKPLGWPGMTAVIEANAAWEDEWQRDEGPEEAARTMLSYIGEDGE